MKKENDIGTAGSVSAIRFRRVSGTVDQLTSDNRFVRPKKENASERIRFRRVSGTVDQLTSGNQLVRPKKENASERKAKPEKRALSYP